MQQKDLITEVQRHGELRFAMIRRDPKRGSRRRSAQLLSCLRSELNLETTAAATFVVVLRQSFTDCLAAFRRVVRKLAEVEGEVTP